MDAFIALSPWLMMAAGLPLSGQYPQSAPRHDT
jgi:hypothetical protein